MAENKTQMTKADVRSYLETVMPARRASESLASDALFREVTGYQPRMWGNNFVALQEYRYT